VTGYFLNELAQWVGISTSALLAIWMLRVSRKGAQLDKDIRARLFGDGK
jgi:hypothetical protein